MADAYFRVRHEPAATLTSCGPGSCNIVMPLQVALSDSSAVFAITATQGGFAIHGDFVLDSAGFVVSQQLGPPLNTTFTRRAK